MAKSKYPSKATDRTFMVVDFTPLMSLRREYAKDRIAMFRAVGERHAQMLRHRFISNAAGKGGWPELAEETKRTKKWDMIKRGYTGSVNWILRRSSKMANSIDYDIAKTTTYHGYSVGFIRDRRYSRSYSKFTVLQLAQIHHLGLGRVPARPVVARPSPAQHRTLMNIVRKRFNKLVKQSNANAVIQVR